MKLNAELDERSAKLLIETYQERAIKFTAMFAATGDRKHATSALAAKAAAGAVASELATLRKSVK